MNKKTFALAVPLALTAGLSLGFAHQANASDINWDAIANCESSGNWHANTGNGYYGGLQFTLQTWQANGGSGNPANASRSEQIRVAENVVSSQGLSAWPECGVEAYSHLPAAKSAPQTFKVPQSQHSGSDKQWGHINKKHYKYPVDAVPYPPARPLAFVYVVQKGDILGEIARHFQTTVKWLAESNHIKNPNLIYPGEKIRVGF